MPFLRYYVQIPTYTAPRGNTQANSYDAGKTPVLARRPGHPQVRGAVAHNSIELSGSKKPFRPQTNANISKLDGSVNRKKRFAALEQTKEKMGESGALATPECLRQVT